MYFALPIFLCYAGIVNAQYCTPLHFGACFGDQIEDFSIAGTSLSNLGSGCAALTGTAYSIYPATGNTTTSLEIGQTYQVIVKCTFAANVSIWIDFDHNNTFDANEWTQVADTTIANLPALASITIPASAMTGTTRMRIRCNKIQYANGPINACSAFNGETEDYNVNLIQGSGCSGVPVAGTVYSPIGPVCAASNLNLQITGCPYAPGYSYQWESSPDNINWSPVSGAIHIAYYGKQTNNTYYRCVVSCGALNATTPELLIQTTPFLNCYCSSTATNQTGADIGNVNFLSLNNGVGTPAVNNVNSSKKYTDFTGLPPVSVTQGISNPMTITQITNGSPTNPSFIDVYIDFNHNSKFESNEQYAFGSTTTTNNILSRNIVIPYTALTGITKMRVVLIEKVNAAQASCSNYYRGETEDYHINILQGSACTSPPVAGTTYTVNPILCAGDLVQVSLHGFSNGVGQTYQWQSSTDNLNWTNISGTNDTMYSALIASPVYYQCILTCGGMTSVSTSILVQNNPICSYCTNTLGGGGCLQSSDIDRVMILNTPFDSYSVNTCNVVGTPSQYNIYSSYPLSAPTTATLLRSQSYTIQVDFQQIGLPISIWIDYNQDGQFSNTECISIDTLQSISSSSAVFTVPSGIPIGTTRMRVRSGRPQFPPFYSPNYACTLFYIGETEDFFVSIDFPTKFPEISEETQLKIWPNPASKELKISHQNAIGNMQVKLFNLAGQAIFEEIIIQNANHKESAIDVSHIDKGIYFLQVILQGESINRKIIIE